jgi:outer membrane lipoprotein SlyB
MFILPGSGLVFAPKGPMVDSLAKGEKKMVSHSAWQRGLQTILLSALLLTVTACSQPLSTREKSTLVGGGVGAAAGTVLGATVGAPGAGAAIGGALGAGGGALAGDQIQRRDEENAAQQEQIREQRHVIQRQREELNRAEENQE